MRPSPWLVALSISCPLLLVAGAARADRADPDWTRPALEVGFDLGASATNEHGPFGFNAGVATVTTPGPAWGARVGVEFVPWLAVELRYLGMYNSARASVSPNGTDGFLTTSGNALLRLALPLPFVRPYAIGGIGYYDVALVGAAGSTLHSSSQWGVPLGFGLEVPISDRLSVSAEAMYHFQLGEDYSTVTTNGIDGGDFSTFTAVVRARI